MTTLPKSTTTLSTTALSTTTEDYAENYYRTGLGPPYEESEPHWERFFGAVASHLVEHVAPATALDVGCAKGFFVDALVRLGVDAYGTDISEYAIASASARIRDRVSVHDLTIPFEGHWDIVSCIEVIEHMAPVDAQRAIDNITAVTDLVLFSSTPHDFVEPTHVNVHPAADWAEWFATRGFFRRTDIDVSGLSPWAVLFERRRLAPPSVVHLYETELASLREEVIAKREGLLRAQRHLDQLQAEQAAAQESAEGRLEAEEEEPEAHDDQPPSLADMVAVERVLTLTDQVIGLRAELGEAQYRYDRYRHEVALQAAEAVAERPAADGGIDGVTRARLAAEIELRQSVSRQLDEQRARAEAAEDRVLSAEARVRALEQSRTWRAARVLSFASRLVRRRVSSSR
jgi:SAM-dependent methyltransferase